jgi:hypothetical protein
LTSFGGLLDRQSEQGVESGLDGDRSEKAGKLANQSKNGPWGSISSEVVH